MDEQLKFALIVTLAVSLGISDAAASADATDFGKALFFATSLSADGKVSCAFCHQPAKAFSDGLATSRGANGRVSTRNTPSLLDVSNRKALFWDGRGARLIDHATDAFFNPVEHGLADFEQLRRTMAADESLSTLYRSAFGRRVETASPAEMSKALTAFLESLKAEASPFDRFFYAKQPQALTRAAARGFELFRGRAGCVSCHTIGEKYALFSDDEFHALGIGREKIERRLPQLVSRVQAIDMRWLGHVVLSEPEVSALGRFVLTRKPADIGKFRTPSLRNVALTAPYMHDGSVATLEEAVELEVNYRGLSEGRRVTLSVDERNDLVEFLRSLTSLRPPAL